MIEINKLSKSFGKNIIFKDLNLNIIKNERLMLCGPSGSGKSTLLNIINKFIKADSGSIKINTDFILNVFQEDRLLTHLTLKENILYYYQIHKLTINNDLSAKITNALISTDLKEFINYYPTQISGGMKQKVSILRAILPSPKLLIMDEPFKSLDIASKHEIISQINTFCANSTIVFTSHDINDATFMNAKIVNLFV